jgi:aspartate aminotransferase-like enzyme
MVPPGLAMISVNRRAWEAYSHAQMPRFYLDFARAKDYLPKGQTPWTPAISIFYALDATLDLMLKEGLQNVFTRHKRVAQMARNGIKSLGLSLFPDESCASNTVTAVNASDKLDVPKLIRILREEHDVVIAGGQRKLSGKIFRIGHMGLVHEDDIKTVLEALDTALPKARC